MATWFEITFQGEPTEADFARVAELAAQGFTSGQLINDDQPEPEARFIGSRRGKVRDLSDAADRGHAWTMAASPPHPFTGDRASEPYCRACGCGAGGIQHTEG